MSEYVTVASIAPCWRYAVGPSNGNCPAVPFYSKVSAKAFFEEASSLLPWAGVTLYRRRFWRDVEELQVKRGEG